jgi:uncharacterized coiled-coil protein SlyX
MDDRITRLEEGLAHLALAVEELSDQMRAQWERIAAMERRLDWLAAQEAERLRDQGDPSVTIGG